MSIVNRLNRKFAAPEERNVTGANSLVQHFAPLELLSITLRCL